MKHDPFLVRNYGLEWEIVNGIWFLEGLNGICFPVGSGLTEWTFIYFPVNYISPPEV